MGNPALRELSRQYNEGELNTSEYRQKRSDIINEMTGDPISSITATSSDNSHSPAAGGMHAIIKIALIAIIFIAVIAIVFINRHGNEGKTTAGTRNNAQQMHFTAVAVSNSKVSGKYFTTS
jgi:uncharacterized membrane protein